MVTKDSIVEIEVLPHADLAEEVEHREKRKWQLAVGGSFGPALVQSGSMMLATNATPPPSIDPNAPEPDAPTYVVPPYIHTWEEYAEYLRFVSSSSAVIPADTLALIRITEHNTGEIVQREHHDMPITFHFLTSAMRHPARACAC